MRRRQPRPRILRSDAALVRSRVEAAAAGLGLRCGLAAVLAAVLALTVGQYRLRDDPAIRHVAVRLPAQRRSLSATTIGRLLARLAALQLIDYVPARGRGRTAQLAIHPRFCEGISELERDGNGKVVLPGKTPTSAPQRAPQPGLDRPPEDVRQAFGAAENVEFSEQPFLLQVFPKRTSSPASPTGAARIPSGSRPIEVDVEHGAPGRVLAAIPGCYRKAPWPVRKHLYRAIHAQLKRGWREEQVIEVLAAPLPAEVRKPLVLARIRFAKSLVGAGPRLRPLQLRWERAQASASKADWEASVGARYSAIVTEVGPHVAQRMATAERHRTAATTVPDLDVDELAQQRAAITAARVVRREYPGQPLRVAVRQWLAVHEPQAVAVPEPPVAPPGDLWAAIQDLLAAAPAGSCTRCGCGGAMTREELPVPAPVCDACWALITAEDQDGAPCGEITPDSSEQAGGALMTA